MCLPLPRWSCRQPTSGGVLVVTGVGLLLINVILGPVTEELYLRGYLLPRLYRFGIWAPLINISLFSLYHYLTRRGMCCPGSSCCCSRVTQSASTGPVSLTNSLPTLLPG